MGKDIEFIIYTFLGGLLYRLGGKEGFNTKVRDFGVPFITGIVIWRLGLLVNPLAVLALIPSLGIMSAALTTYRYFLPKPKDYSWYHYSLHGFMCSLALFPLMFFTGSWLGFWLRVITCTVGLGVWYFVAVKNDDLHEFGRGAILITSLLWFLI